MDILKAVRDADYKDHFEKLSVPHLWRSHPAIARIFVWKKRSPESELSTEYTLGGLFHPVIVV